jgi:hypothetical protein
MKRLIAAAALAAGCSHVDVSITTTVDDAGVVVRHVEAERKGPVERDERRGLLVVLSKPSGSFARVRLGSAKLEVDGRFPPDASLPSEIWWMPEAEWLQPHFRFRNAPAVDRRDLAILRTHRYRESFGAAVGSAEFDAAVDRFVGEAADFAMRVVEEVWGEDYDVEEVRRFVEVDVAREARRLAIDLYEFAAAHKISRWPAGHEDYGARLSALVAAAAARLGLELDFTSEDDARLAAFERWFDARVAPLFLPRRLDAKPVALRRVVEEWPRVEASAQRLLRARYDTEENLECRVAEEFLPPGMAALVAAEASLPFHFVASVSLPGEILRTNGAVIDEQSAGFEFDGAEIFPEGYDMTAESFVVDRAAQERLFGEVLVDDRKRALAFVEALERMNPRTMRAVVAALRAAPLEGGFDALGSLERDATVDGRAVSSLRGWLESLRRSALSGPRRG